MIQHAELGHGSRVRGDLHAVCALRATFEEDLAVAVAASAIPALRAARVDPLLALRAQ